MGARAIGQQTLALAAQLRIRFLWLPKQAPELSPMDQLWRELKRLMAANRQAEPSTPWPRMQLNGS